MTVVVLLVGDGDDPPVPVLVVADAPETFAAMKNGLSAITPVVVALYAP